MCVNNSYCLVSDETILTVKKYLSLKLLIKMLEEYIEAHNDARREYSTDCSVQDAKLSVLACMVCK